MALTRVTSAAIDTDTIAAGDIAANAVTASELADDAVDTNAIANNAVTGTKIALGSDAQGDIMYYNGTDYVRLAKGTAEQTLQMNGGATAPNWITAVSGAAWAIKTSAYTAVNGDGCLVNTGSAVTITLPASPSLGDFVRVIDFTGQAATNNITVARNGQNIQGVASNLTIATNRAAIGLVYTNSTQGWILIEN